MKIRIQGNSIRLRLSKPEVENFQQVGFVAESTEFLENKFSYEIKKLYDGQTMDASFDDKKLTVFVPHHLAEAWKDEKKVGFKEEVELQNGHKLSLLIEKDFKCIDGDTAEDQSNYYDNPLKSC